jgi:DNA-binding NarL/FixJ family response regulator
MTETGKIRVLIADDLKALCDVIRLYLERAEDLVVVGESPHLDEALEEAITLPTDVIIMNDFLPPVDSAVAAALFRERGITAIIVAISMETEPKLIHRSFQSGVDGFLHKNEIDEVLVHALRCVKRGERYLSPKAREAYDSIQE